MVTILSNVSALAASRQLGISKLGLNQAITRLTTGRRVNSAYDDAASQVAGNTAQANSRAAAASVVTDQAAYFAAVAADGNNANLTNQAYRMAELEGSGNTSTSEYSNLKTATSGTSSTNVLSTVASNSATNAGNRPRLSPTPSFTGSRRKPSRVSLTPTWVRIWAPKWPT